MSRVNGGSSAVDGQSFEGIKHQGIEGWLEQLAQELRKSRWSLNRRNFSPLISKR
jgi:hypothetical protein